MAIKTPFDNLILLPREVLQQLKTASAEELKILLYLFANPESDINEASRETGVNSAQAQSAFAFWRGAGIFEESSGKKKNVTSDTSAYRNYDSATIANALTKDEEFALVCRIASDKLEKMLTKNDHSSLFYLYDYVRLPAPVICGIIEQCCKNDKRSLQYIVKKAIALYEDGIDTYDKYEAYLAKLEFVNSEIGKLRKLCGMGDRALTAKESKAFDTWFSDWNLPFDMVRLAFEKTVDNTGKVSITYMNSILKRWHESGFTSVEDVKKGEAGRTAGTESSFAGDEFIEAALNRGFDD
jgi:DnaD/phage-associated family protein